MAYYPASKFAENYFGLKISRFAVLYFVLSSVAFGVAYWFDQRGETAASYVCLAFSLAFALPALIEALVTLAKDGDKD